MKKYPQLYPLFCLAALVFVCGLSGCGYQQIIAERGADASDQALESALWSICNAMPVGAINRRFQTEEDKAAYETLCP